MAQTSLKPQAESFLSPAELNSAVVPSISFTSSSLIFFLGIASTTSTSESESRPATSVSVLESDSESKYAVKSEGELTRFGKVELKAHSLIKVQRPLASMQL